MYAPFAVVRRAGLYRVVERLSRRLQNFERIGGVIPGHGGTRAAASQTFNHSPEHHAVCGIVAG